MALGFQQNAFQGPGFQGGAATGSTGPASGRGLGGAGRKRRYGEDVTEQQWREMADLRDRLADMDLARKAPAALVREVRRRVGPIVQRAEVEPEVYAAPDFGQPVRLVLEGLVALLDYLAKIDAIEAQAREAYEQELRDDDEAAAMLLLH
jgi:hypothetical protein